ncbi:probable G-protein coupled receptor 25 [Elgaria multicarinata webbii]|uniref:probable G-protein coupled receptor 25 n=1 Tax=Elgaria multicarinata webbii TaxID=159646 RepID=UPI002FCCD68E
MEAAQLETGSVITESWNSGSESSITDYYDSNITNDDTCILKEMPFAYIFIPTFYIITFLVGFFGNLLVILLMARKQGSKRLVDTFVLNLAIADLVFVCTLPFWAVSEALSYWCFSEGLCKFSSYALSVNRYSSMLFLTGMSVERFLVISKHWDSKSIGTKKSTGISCGCIWLVSLLLGIPSLVYRKLILVGKNKSLCQDEEPSPTFNLVILALTFLLPLGIILFCYCSISSKLRGHVSLGKRRNNALKIIFAIIGAFICSWLPFNTIKAYFIFIITQDIGLSCQALMALKWALPISVCLAFTNSCINPVIYVFMDQHFQQQVWKNFPSFCRKRENMQSSALSFSSTESSLLFASRKKLKPALSTQIGDPNSRGTGL